MRMAKVRTRKRGKTYSYIFEVGNVNGKRKVIEKGGYETVQAAYDAGIEAYTDWQHGNIGITNEKICLRDFSKLWLENVCKPNMKKSSLRGYTIVINRIPPELASKRVTDVTPAMIDGFMRKLAEKGLAYATLRHQLTIMREMFSYAVYPAELIASNPAMYVKTPKTQRRKVIERKIISRDEFEQLIQRHRAGTTYHIPLYLLYYTGIRIGELCGLTWDNIDLAAGTISICQQVQQIGGLPPYISTPKTATSVRTIPIGKDLVKELAAWRATQRAYEVKKGGAYVIIYADAKNALHRQSKALKPPADWHRVNFVCTRRNGTLLLKTAIYDKMRRMGLNAHSFRHTHATMLIEAGANPKGVAARLGHASTNITENLYTHITKNMQDDTERVFEHIMQTK